MKPGPFESGTYTPTAAAIISATSPWPTCPAQPGSCVLPRPGTSPASVCSLSPLQITLGPNPMAGQHLRDG